MLFLLLFVWSSVSGIQYEGGEGQELSLEWRSPQQLDLPMISGFVCYHDHLKTMIRVENGVRRKAEPHFSGRVEWNTEALKDGQVQLRLTHLTALDSGKCECRIDCYATDNSWSFMYTERFEISVSPSPTPTTTTKPTQAPGAASGPVTKQSTESHNLDHPNHNNNNK
ncbi:hypothetical protein NL108_015904 [Boleophthalmus pectinirostris]|nr:hypothetical protein NL108_015904 [Boleophthalmus pectinirostris]